MEHNFHGDGSERELADAARIGVATVRLFEGEAAETRHATLAVLRRALEAAGVEFTNGDQPGVRLTKVPALSAKAARSSKPENAAKAVRNKAAKATGKRR